MQGDDRSRIQVAKLDLDKVNEALRKLSDWVTRIEGRSGPVKLRDSIALMTAKQTVMDIESTESGNASIVQFGTENATIAIAKGARKEDNGEWIARDTSATIFALTRAGEGNLYYNSNLTVNQAFEPTLIFSIGTSGTVGAHALSGVGSPHTMSGLTTGHVLQATAATTFGFGALAASNVVNTPAGNIAATNVQAALNELDTEKAALASPTFTGTPAAPTAAVGTSTTQIATTAFVDAEAVAKAGDTMTGDLTLTSGTTAKPDLTVINTNADATGPEIILQKDSASPAASDVMGSIVFKTDDSAGNADTGAQIDGVVIDPTSTSEDARLEIKAITGGTVGNAASITGSAAASTAPSLYAYFKPISFKKLASSSSAITLTGSLGNAFIFSTARHDTSGGKIALQTVASVANAGITLTEAGVYQILFQTTLSIGNNAGATVYAARYNSSNTIQEYGNVLSWTNVTGSTRDFYYVGAFTVEASANDYIIITHNGTYGGDVNSNHICVARLN